MDKIARIDELVDKLNEYSYYYYTLDDPLVSDAEYDSLFDELVNLEKENDYIRKDSPSQKVGDILLEGFNKHEHVSRLYSMNKAQNYDELRSFDQRIKKDLAIDTLEYIVELKFDGLSISLTYDDGILQTAATRGNGYIGEDVSEQIKRIPSVPLSIKNKNFFEIGGEAYMPIDAFNKYNEENEEKLKNPRNGAAGAIRNLDTSIMRQRSIDAYFYNINTSPDISFENDFEIKEFLKDQGFKISNIYYLCKDIDEVIEKAQEITAMRDDLNYMIDGVVVKVNRIDYREKLGYTNRFPRWAIAYKFEAEEAYTILNDVQWNVGRTSKVTPSAILEPVEIDGVTVSRATLNNYNFIESLDIRINSEVRLRRSNDVIPEILEANNAYRETKKIEKPKKCPACSSDLNEIGAHLFCPNKLSCPPQMLAEFTHFVSRNCMNIEGVSERTIEQFMEKLDFTRVSDFYRLEYKDLEGLDGFKEKKINNTLESIENSREVNFINFINALGILNVGTKASYDLANYFDNIEELMDASYEELIELDYIGPSIAESIVAFFSNEKNLEELESLKELGVKIIYPDQEESDILKDLTFVITGSFDDYSRKDLENIIVEYGGKVTGFVSGNTDYLLLGENPGSKYDKAKELGTEIIDLEKLRGLIGD